MPPLAPRPFRQLAVRCYRLGLAAPKGYMGGLNAGNLPWYERPRRRPVITPTRTLARHVCESRAWKARMRSLRPRLVRCA